eukprot:scaffold36889_cov64-Attheya_sp.AAC.2
MKCCRTSGQQTLMLRTIVPRWMDVSHMGILKWIVEISRVDIITEVSMLASQLALPRWGDLDTVLHIYAYLDIKHNSTMVFDPTYPDNDMRDFKDCDWSNFMVMYRK